MTDTKIRAGRELKYVMPRACYNDIISTFTEGEKKKNQKQAVIDIINDTYGLLGTVTDLVVED